MTKEQSIIENTEWHYNRLQELAKEGEFDALEALSEYLQLVVRGERENVGMAIMDMIAGKGDLKFNELIDLALITKAKKLAVEYVNMIWPKEY